MAEIGQTVAHGEHGIEEAAVLDDRDLGSAVPNEELDLLGRRRVVDRDRRCAHEERGDVRDVELGAVAHQQHDPGPPSDPELGERGRDPRRFVARTAGT